MKILLLTTHLNTGGISTYTVNLARYLKGAGIEVTVASSGGNLTANLEKEDIPHVVLDIRTKSEFGIKVWKALPKLKRLVGDGNYDIIHAQTRVAQVLASLVKRSMGVPFISTCHGFFKSQRISRRLFPCWGDKVIAISKSVSAHLIEDLHVPKERVKMIYNGIELDRYQVPGASMEKNVLKENIGLGEDAFTVGTVGRLSPVKGHAYLIDAFKEAIRKQPGMQLLIVGEGPDEEMLKEKVRKAEITDKVFFAPGNDVPLEEYFSIMDIFCLASTSEGLGFSLMEAMAAGRPCIASNVGGLAELIIHTEDGLLVPSRDVSALGDAIHKLFSDGSLRQQLSDKARKKALSSFSIKDSVKKTVEVYKEIVDVRDKR
ncbi:MAG: glycosyltransferase family 4 protein [Candidatus Omnitrophota bacterium]